MNKHLVLLVDDDAGFREIWKMKLTSSGFDVLEASNGKEALEILKYKKPDVILLDILMPEMNGIETLLEIKENNNLKDIKVFFITSLDAGDPELIQYHKRLASELGAVEYLRKSIDLDNLVERISNSLKK
jgi:CheY-like chemotaxis protein